MTIKNFLSGILAITIILCVIAVIIGLPIGVGIFVHNVVYDVTDPSSHMEKIRSETIIQEIKYDVFAEDLENKFVEIEGVGLGGAGAHVGQVFFLADVDLQILLTGMLAYHHALVNLGARSNE